MNILICSQLGESQIPEICDLIKTYGGTPVIFERYRHNHYLTYSYSQQKIEAQLKIDNITYPLRSDVFPVVWSRLKPITFGEIPGEESTLNEKFCAHEWKHALNALDIFLKDSKWVNNPDCQQAINRKVYQLQLAQTCGLDIPVTCISNDSATILPLFEKGNVIYKTLSSFFTLTETIFTSPIIKPQVKNNHETIMMAPGIYQEAISKDHELRVTVIGNQIFTVKIESQKNNDTKTDWRKRPFDDMYRLGFLSSNTAKKLLTFHQKAGLVYAAYDFIVDREGKEIFLECNPSGQWIWLENNLDLNITEALALELTKR